MKLNNQQKNKGFTLIELMVATTLFVVIMLAAMSSLFTLLHESKDSRALRIAMDNVNFAMESMTRSIRMGVGYSRGTDSIYFRSQNDVYITYQLAGNTIEKCDPTCVPIISTDVNIDMLNFSINPTLADPSIQPSVYIMVKGTVKVNGVPTSFAIQTLASQRNF